MANQPDQLYTIKYFQGGLSDFEDSGVRGSFKRGRAIDIRKSVNSISCNQALAAEGAGVIADLILFIVPASDGNTYLFGDTGKIYKRTSGGTITLEHTDTDGKIRGAAEWYNDEGKAFLYWATSTALNRKEIPGESDWSDVNEGSFKKTNLTSTDWHTMGVANGSLMIANKDKLAMVGYDDSYTNEALLLFPGNVAKAILERINTVVVGTGRDGSAQEGHLFAWEQTALSWLAKKKIPTKGINAMIDTEVMLMQAGDEGGVYFSDMTNVLPSTTFPGGGTVNPGGVASFNGLALFGVFGNGADNTGIYSYGRLRKNATFALNLEYPIAAEEIGSISVVGDTVLVGYKVLTGETTTYHFASVNSAAKQVAEYQTIDLKSPFKMHARTLWKMLRLHTKDMPASTKIEAFYRLDKDESGDNHGWIAAKTQAGETEFTAGKEAIFIIGSEGDIIEVKLVLTPSGNNSPEVYKIDVIFS